MRLPRAPLEDWLRDRYFDAVVDISSSGVAVYSLAELRELLGIDIAELDSIVFRDSRTRGDVRLCKAIADRWAGGDPERVMAANGSSEMLFLLMISVLRPGDEVVVLDPAYQSLVAIAEGIGCRIVPWRLRGEDGFAPDPDELASLLSPSTRMLVVNFPHNPTGVTVDADTQRHIIDLAAGIGCYLLWDAVFADLVYDRPPLVDASRLYERAITVGTLSKAYGLPGLRVGWCIAPPEILATCVSQRDYTTLALSPLVELFAIKAIENAEVLLSPRLALARRNLGLLDGWMARHADQVDWNRPQGGVTAFPSLRRVPDVEEFCQRLMLEHGTLLVPGSCFGRAEHVRLGFGGPTHELERGLAAMARLLGNR